MHERVLPAGLAVGIVFSSFAADAFRITPYVQHPATNAMSVIWFTSAASGAVIKWWPASGGETRQIATTGVWAAALTNNLAASESGCAAIYKHNVRLTGLATGTRYRYAVELADDGPVYTNAFKTVPGPGSSVRFVCYADCETLPGPKTTSDWIDPVTGSSRSYFVTKTVGYASNIVHMVKREPDIFVIAGDLAQQGGKQTHWDEFWKHNAGACSGGYDDPAGAIPILAAIGNHDLQDAVPKPSGMNVNCENVAAAEVAVSKYLSYFEFEPNGIDFSGVDSRDRSQLFHRQDYGPVTLIFLDTNNGDDGDVNRDPNIYLFRDANCASNKWGLASARTPDYNPGSAQYAWLTNNLADAQRKSKFTFVVNHQCPYSVGYHCRVNVTEGGEWLSGRPLRVLNETLLKYGVTGWFCGHDEMMEHSRIYGTETLPDGTTRDTALNIYDIGIGGDGLRGGQMTAEANAAEVFRAHVDAPEVWENGILKSGGKHYGHLEVNVREVEPGLWTATLEPVYIFVYKDANGIARGFERRVYDDVLVLTNDLRSALAVSIPENVYCVTPDAAGGGNGKAWTVSGDNAPMKLAEAMTAAAGGGEIWLKGETFTLTVALSVSFSGEVTIRGGFAGTESSAAERAAGTKTVLDGEEIYSCLMVANTDSLVIERVVFTCGKALGMFVILRRTGYQPVQHLMF